MRDGDYYRESGRVSRRRLAALAAALIPAAAAGGVLYGALASRVPRALSTLAGALVTGGVIGLALGRGAGWARVRSALARELLGLLAGGAAWYAAAVTYLYGLGEAARPGAGVLAPSPDAFGWLAARLRTHAAPFDAAAGGGDPWVLWVGGGALVLTLAATRHLAAAAARDRIFCEACGAWVTRELRVSLDEVANPKTFRGALEARHYPPLFALGPAAADAPAFTRLRIRDCPGCERWSFLSAEACRRLDGGGVAADSTPLVAPIAVGPEVYAEFEKRALGEWAAAGIELVDGDPP